MAVSITKEGILVAAYSDNCPRCGETNSTTGKDSSLHCSKCRATLYFRGGVIVKAKDIKTGYEFKK